MIPFFNSNGTNGSLGVTNTLNVEQTVVVSNDIVWHHDCSNISSWLIDPNPPQIRLNEMQDDVDILSDGSAIYSSSIPYTTGRWHGSVFFYELTTPVYVGHGLNFEVELNHPGTSNYAGGMEVGLYDQDKNISYWVSITDSWYSSSFSTDVAYGDDGVNYVHTTPRSGSLVSEYRVWNNETANAIQGQDNQGTYTLANAGEFEQDREIHYVGIMFWNVESYNYESNLVLDILIEGKSVENAVIWHDDCSSNSTFSYLANESWFTGSMGAIDSADGYIYATDYGIASGSHGPVYYQPFNDSITVGQLDWFEAEIEVDASSAALGAAAVFLFDNNFKRVALLDVADSWTGYDDTAAYAGWYTPEQTSTTTPNTWPTDTVLEPYRETLRMSFNDTGVFANIPRVGNFKLIDIANINLNRTISYIGVNLRTKDSYATCEILRIHDIRMQYRLLPPNEDTTPPDIIGPSDCNYELGSINHTLAWSVFDSNPYLYTVFRDGEILQHDYWNDSEIVINIDGLDLGYYLFTLNVSDISLLYTCDMVNVSVVDTTAPQIDHPFDIILEHNYENISITWNPTDLKPSSYELYQNGTMVASGSWNNSQIVYHLDGLVTGAYLYTLYVNDTSGNVATDSVLVVVNPQGIPINMTIVISIGSAVVIVVVIVLILKTKSPSGAGSGTGYQW
jgi:hypothetical protein